MIDKVQIIVQAGDGGDGRVSFRRERYVPRGGPDGGDGGDGGDIVLRAQEGQHLLRAFMYRREFKAEKGGGGGVRDRSGRRGKSVVLDVPLGTMVYRVKKEGDRELLGDLSMAGQTLVVVRGGGGGRGNTHFTSAVNQVPRLAESGESGERAILDLEMRLIADIGVIGVPNAGKSSFLHACSRARPDIASYPFTTLEPILGFVERTDGGFTVVEIPGLIEGAHRGVGLGDEFLRHMERTKGVIHILDGSSEDVMGDYLQVREEMRLYQPLLLEKPEIVVINKIDLPEARERLDILRAAFQDREMTVCWMSALTREGVDGVLDAAAQVVESQRRSEQPPVPELPIIQIRPRVERPYVERHGEVFVLKSSQAERLVRQIDLEDWNVQVQLWNELQRMGAVRALKQAGARSGSVVRIGECELEWK